MKTALGFIKAIVEVSHIGYASYDLKKHQLLFSSGLCEKILGYSADEFRELSYHFFEKIIHPDDQQKLNQMLDHLLDAQQDDIITALIRYRKANGDYLWIYSRRIVWQRDKTGDSLKVASVLQDVTEAVGLQEELRQSIQVLQEISYKNSHQIRGPVSTIMGLTNLMDDKGFINDFNRDLFHYLQAAIMKLDGVIHDISYLANEAVEEANRTLNQQAFKP